MLCIVFSFSTDIMNKRIKEEQNFLEKQKELQENICQVLNMSLLFSLVQYHIIVIMFITKHSF